MSILFVGGLSSIDELYFHFGNKSTITMSSKEIKINKKHRKK